MGTPKAGLWGIKEGMEWGVNGINGQRGGGNTLLQTDDGAPQSDEVIYLYNILPLEHIVEQPPTFPRLKIEACPPGEKFIFTILPRFTKLPYERNGAREGTTEISYRYEDGRKAATSLLNPSAFPGTDWRSQLQVNRSGHQDQFGNNLNAYGVFWSLLAPDDPGLDEQIKMIRARVDMTMDTLIKEAEALATTEKTRQDITPRMHFAMDYRQKKAPWHMSTKHMIDCPNCGETIPEGIKYHRNAWGERCIIDLEGYEKTTKQVPEVRRAVERQEIPESKAVDESGGETVEKKKSRKGGAVRP